MTSRVIIPFNNDPVNTFVTDSTYTVPVGKFAKVVCTIKHAVLLLNDNIVDYSILQQDTWSISDGGNNTGGERDIGTSTRHGNYYIAITNYHQDHSSIQLRQYRNGILIWTSPSLGPYLGTATTSFAYRQVKKGDVFKRYLSDTAGGSTFSAVFYSEYTNGTTPESILDSSVVYSNRSKQIEFWVKQGDVVSLQNPIINTNVQTTGQGFDTIATILVQEYNKVT